MSGVGHNSFAKNQLKAVIERVERLEDEKKSISDDIRDVFAEAKANGFDVKALRTIVRLRKMEKTEREEQQAVLETYMHALGMLADLPLGQAAIARDLPDAIEGAGNKADVSNPPFNPDDDEPRVAGE